MSAADDRVTNAIHQAVQQAIQCGWSVRRFVQDAGESWDFELRDAAKDAEETFRSFLAPRVK